jgi:shikimate dehydrogenase
MTDRYAVIGNPIAHSKSPLIHAVFAGLTLQDMTYEAILAPLDGYGNFSAELKRQTDIVAFARTWVFTRADRLTSE